MTKHPEGKRLESLWYKASKEIVFKTSNIDNRTVFEIYLKSVESYKNQKFGLSSWLHWANFGHYFGLVNDNMDHVFAFDKNQVPGDGFLAQPPSFETGNWK